MIVWTGDNNKRDASHAVERSGNDIQLGFGQVGLLIRSRGGSSQSLSHRGTDGRLSEYNPAFESKETEAKITQSRSNRVLESEKDSQTLKIQERRGDGEGERQSDLGSAIDCSVDLLRPSRGSDPQPRSCSLTHHASLRAPSSSLPTSKAAAARERCYEGPGDLSPEPSSELAHPPRSTTTTQRSNRPLSTSRSERPARTGNASWPHGPLRCFRPSKSRSGSRKAR